MFITTRAEDAKRVFINGKYVAEASNTEKLMDFALSPYAQPGSNLVEISYEAFGAPSENEALGELKGLESAGIGTEFASAKSLESWQIQRHSAIINGFEINNLAMISATERSNRKRAPGEPGSSAPTWLPFSLERTSGHHSPVPAFTWFRANFLFPKKNESWNAPWKLIFEADCDALIYLNGKFVGRFVTQGPQREFYFPEPFLELGGQNTLMIALAHTDDPRHLRTLQVAPYPEYTVRRTRFEFEW